MAKRNYINFLERLIRKERERKRCKELTSKMRVEITADSIVCIFNGGDKIDLTEQKNFTLFMYKAHINYSI